MPVAATTGHDHHAATGITDTAATFLELAGVEDLQAALPESPSQSLWTLWRGGTLRRRYAFSENSCQFHAPFKALCDGEWKYVSEDFTGRELLYHLTLDPLEQDDRSSR